MSDHIIRPPFGPPEYATVELTAGGEQAVAINCQMTIIDGISVPQTSATTLNLTIGAGVKPGAILYLSRECNSGTAGNRDFIFGTGITAETHQPATAKEVHRAFIYNGTAFVPMGAFYVEA
jgi:hypothetical protein